MTDIQVCIGNAALATIKSSVFQQQWQALYARCPWATICQSMEFATTWYDVYEEKYQPVIVFAFSTTKKMLGLFALAISKDQGTLVAAGASNAEYQCWLEDPCNKNDFIRNALPRIFAAFPRHNLSLKYLPPAVPMDWIAVSDRHRLPWSVRAHKRPLMKTDDINIANQMRRKSTKRKLASLKRCGEVHFETVADHTQFVEVFDEICMQCDQRQEAARAVTPFAADPLKKRFYIELHKRGLIHSTILRVNGRLAASHTGLLSRDCVQLNIITHAQEWSSHSPGAVHLAMLSAQLNKEAIPLFDLTPGNDPYKELFANEHDTVFELNLYKNWHIYYRSKFLFDTRRAVKYVCVNIGIDPAKLRILFRRWIPNNRLRFPSVATLGIMRGTQRDNEKRKSDVAS